MALFYEIPSDLFSFPSFYQPRRSVYRQPVLPTVIPGFEIVAEKPRQLHVPIKKRHSGELKLQEDGENGWFAHVELPGVRSIKNVDLELQDKTLLVHAKAKSDYQTVLNNYTLQVPEGVDEKEIRGVLSNGVLKISLPKLKPVEPEKPKEQPASNSLANKLELPSNNIFSIWQRCLQGPKETSEVNETHHITRLAFPEGFNKEHLDIEFNKGVLTISAQKKDDLSTFSFKRSVSLPKNLTENDITAKFEGNTLEIQYPKETPKEESSFKIQIASTSSDLPAEKVEESKTETEVESPATPSEEHHEVSEVKKEEGQESEHPKEEEHNDATAGFEIVDEEEQTVA